MHIYIVVRPSHWTQICNGNKVYDLILVIVANILLCVFTTQIDGALCSFSLEQKLRKLYLVLNYTLAVVKPKQLELESRNFTSSYPNLVRGTWKFRKIISGLAVRLTQTCLSYGKDKWMVIEMHEDKNERKKYKSTNFIEKKIFWNCMCFGILDFLSSFSSYKMEDKKRLKLPTL